jgi:hypothetical protein
MALGLRSPSSTAPTALVHYDRDIELDQMGERGRERQHVRGANHFRGSK